MAKRGRGDKWTQLNMDNKLILVEGWARDGLTEKQIAEKLGIGISTLNRWKKDKVEFLEALKKGKEVIDREVENALLKSALGFFYEEETVTNKGDVVTVRKYEKPNTTAAIFWLKNRKPHDWRDKVVTEHEGKINHEIVVEWGGSFGADDDENQG